MTNDVKKKTNDKTITKTNNVKNKTDKTIKKQMKQIKRIINQ